MKSGKIARYGLMIALAMILSYVELLVPMSFAVPGIKLGLANIVAVFVLYTMSAKDAAIISCIRVMLNSMLFSNMYAFVYSIVGAAISLAVMAAMKHSGKFTVVGVSAAGGVCHNLGQILVAAAVFETGKIAYYFPVLCISGTITGIFIGITAGLLTDRLKNRM